MQMNSLGSLPRLYVFTDVRGCRGPPMCRCGRCGGTQYARVRLNLQGWEEAVSRVWGSVSACFTKRSHRGLDTPFPSRGRGWVCSPPTEAGKSLCTLATPTGL